MRAYLLCSQLLLVGNIIIFKVVDNDSPFFQLDSPPYRLSAGQNINLTKLAAIVNRSMVDLAS